MKADAIAKQSRKIIVMLGAGRSGTSLVMQILNELGMRLSNELIPGVDSNPKGFFEDIEIVNIQKELISNLQITANMPLPENWQEMDASHNALKKIKAVIKNRVDDDRTIWGFKDPRTAMFLPIWIKAFNSQWIRPIYILTVRDPRAVTISLQRITNRESSIFEMMWLYRYCEALYHTSANCYIIHYEEWFSSYPERIAAELLEYCGLNQYQRGIKKDPVIKDLIKENLNRSIFSEHIIQNKYVVSLYDVLKKCRGNDFDRVALMDTVIECRKVMSSFSGWNIEARRLFEIKYNKIKKDIKQQDRVQKELKQKLQQEIQQEIDEKKKLEAKLEKEVNTRISLEADMENIVLQNNSYLKEVKDLADKIENLRRSISVASGAKKDAIRKQQLIQKRLNTLQTSLSYRLGNLFVLSIKKPGKNTILLPFRLLKLFFTYIFVRTPA